MYSKHHQHHHYTHDHHSFEISSNHSTIFFFFYLLFLFLVVLRLLLARLEKTRILISFLFLFCRIKEEDSKSIHFSACFKCQRKLSVFLSASGTKAKKTFHRFEEQCKPWQQCQCLLEMSWCKRRRKINNAR